MYVQKGKISQNRSDPGSIYLSTSFQKSLFVMLLLPDNWKLIHITSGKYFCVLVGMWVDA